METLTYFADFILHIDKHLDLMIQSYGSWSYAILFLIIFCETGLVVTPFLPGDSLLFAVGALSARGGLDVHILAITMLVAAVLGNTVNYAIGNYVGPKVFEKKDSKIFKRHYLERTQGFFDRYGGKTIIITRFVPIIRTFAPFLAGVARMHYAKFTVFNIAGGALWVGSLTYAGFLFGEQPIVKNNFGLVVIAIIIISILPALFEILKARKVSEA